MFGDGKPITIAVVNHATTPFGYDLTAVLKALQVQASNHFAPAYGMESISLTVVQPGEPIPAGAWTLALLDDANQAGALGYHDIGTTGTPVGKVFVKTTLEDNEVVPVTISHELLEMLADPDINLVVQVGRTTFYAYEACDAVEETTYEINGIPVSNFVLPDWFQEKVPVGTKVDYLGLCKAPLTLLSGGYIGVWTPTRGWTQKTARSHRTKTHKHRHNDRAKKWAI